MHKELEEKIKLFFLKRCSGLYPAEHLPELMATIRPYLKEPLISMEEEERFDGWEGKDWEYADADPDKWIDVHKQKPPFYGDNVMSDRITGKGDDGVIKKNVSLFYGDEKVCCYGTSREYYHANIIQWQPLGKKVKINQ